MKVLLLCLHAFETMEFAPFIDVFGWARDDFDCPIEVVTCGFQKQVMTTFHVPVIMDICIEDVVVEEYDAIALPGGFEEYGFYKEAYDERTLQLLRDFNAANKWIASVCVAAFPLAKSGVLKDRSATTYHLRNGFKRNELASYGVELGEPWLVIDKNIITSSCPKSAPDVAFVLLEQLTSKEVADKVRAVMGFSQEGSYTI